MFVQKYGVLCLENFDCPTGVSPWLFSQLCVFHHCKAGGFQSDNVTLTINGQQQLSKKKAQNFTINEDGLLGKVLIGNANEPICVPGNSALTIPGRLDKNTKVSSGTPCLTDTTAVNNLPQASPYWQQKFIGLNISHGIMGLNYIMWVKILRWHFSHYHQLILWLQ